MTRMDIARAWGWRPEQIEPLPGGLINKTFVVREFGEPVAVLQQLHTIFGPDVNLDLEAVTSHLAAKGYVTPRLIRTLDGQPCVEENAVWRALTWIEGETVHKVPSPAWAEAGGALVGRFHRAIADLDYDYRFTRSGVHDTPAHLARLRGHVEAGGAEDAVELGREILAAASALPAMPSVPHRHVHGDLKISNLLFRRTPLEGICLVDLDTLAKGTMAFELGDAMRSWCNPIGEDAASVRFDLAIFAAAIRGFRSEADALITREELASVVVGLETVCIELAARFAVDVFEDNYFGWDPSRYPTRRAHNLVRSYGQLALGRAVGAARDEAVAATGEL